MDCLWALSQLFSHSCCWERGWCTVRNSWAVHTHSWRGHTDKNTHSQTLLIVPLRNLCSSKTWSECLWDLVSNGSCKEESCYYSRIYYILLSTAPWDGKPNFYYWKRLWSLNVYTHLSQHVLCMVLPQRLDSAGCRFSAERAMSPRSAPIPLTEVPKASLAAPTSTEETKQFMRWVMLTNTNSLIKHTY